MAAAARLDPQAGTGRHLTPLGCGMWLKCHVYRDWFVPEPESMPFQLWMLPSSSISGLQLPLSPNFGGRRET